MGEKRRKRKSFFRELRSDFTVIDPKEGKTIPNLANKRSSPAKGLSKNPSSENCTKNRGGDLKKDTWYGGMGGGGGGGASVEETNSDRRDVQINELPRGGRLYVAQIKTNLGNENKRKVRDFSRLRTWDQSRL